MRILVDGEVFQHGLTGIAKVTRGLYSALVRYDPALEVAFLSRRSALEALPETVASIPVWAGIPARLWRSTVVPGICMRWKPDVIHFPWNGRVGPFLSPPVVTTIHDVLPLAIPSFFPDENAEERYRRVMRRDIARSNLIITDSQFSRDEIERYFRPRIEIVVVLPATDIAKTTDGNFSPIPGGYFLYVGGYDRRKGIEELLRAFHAGHRSHRLDQKIVLTGEPRSVTDDCSRLIREGKEAGFVEEWGYVDENRLAALYRHATALVYPSRYEGFGLPPLEALTLGCPVLTTSGTSLREVCGDAVVYIDPAATASFVEALAAFEKDSEFRRMLISRGLKQAKRFSWDVSARKFHSLLIAHGR